ALSNYRAWPGAIAMIASVVIFFIEYISLNYIESAKSDSLPIDNNNDPIYGNSESLLPAGGLDRNSLLTIDAQIMGIIILEIGICLHSIIIGLALSASTGSDFISLWMFEGLGLGSRIAELNYTEHSIKPWLMSCAYGLTTPIGIAMGLGIHGTYNPASQTALLVQGVLDSVSAGILLYTALVELMANDFIYNPEFRNSSKIKQLAAFTCLVVGIALMALIGMWNTINYL
ncbi:14048_t:CDS:2, partial [Racocetra fulgida]